MFGIGLSNAGRKDETWIRQNALGKGNRRAGGVRVKLQGHQLRARSQNPLGERFVLASRCAWRLGNGAGTWPSLAAGQAALGAGMWHHCLSPGRSGGEHVPVGS